MVTFPNLQISTVRPDRHLVPRLSGRKMLDSSGSAATLTLTEVSQELGLLDVGVVARFV